MATTLKKPIPSNNLLIIPEVTWTQLETIEASFQEIGGVRFTYLDGVVEIMNLSLEHEESKAIIRALLEAYMREPDESYNIHSKKAIPDLVIEVIISSGGINKLELYKRIGIPEVWFWEDGVLKIYHLQENYQLLEKSSLLPDLDLKILTKYITYHDQYDAVTEFIKELSIK